MKNLPILLLGLLFVAAVALFAKGFPLVSVSDDEPNEQTYYVCRP
jgi:hypothetical protein